MENSSIGDYVSSDIYSLSTNAARAGNSDRAKALFSGTALWNLRIWSAELGSTQGDE